ncbi:MAG TPA: hypothetical protein VMV52_04700 [Candidatus Nanopelagicaceae bacterium]|nr:hypothetical protein [Candidatus Nanopelagicaceae bacterium]
MSIKIKRKQQSNLRQSPRGTRDGRLRTFASALAIIVSVVAGIALIGASDKSVMLWGVAQDLGIGSTIREGDLTLRAAHLDRETAIYLSGSYNPLGLYVTRELHVGELLPATAVVKNDGLPIRRIVTVEVESHHAPPDLVRGDLVDLYLTPYGTGGEVLGEPTRVIADAPVDLVASDPNSTHLGVALSLLDVDVPVVVAAAQRGHLDLVGRR